jgi:hypothetical protein
VPEDCALAGYDSQTAFAPTVIVFIPRSAASCNGAPDGEWLMRRCPACGQGQVIGHGRRWRQAHDRLHSLVRVRRGKCKVCHCTFTCLAPECIPGAVYTLPARQQAIAQVAAGASCQDAIPLCSHPDRVADPSTIRRWLRRRLASLPFIGTCIRYHAPTILAWDCLAFCRILFPEVAT